MSRSERWLVGIGVAGFTASAAVAALGWLLFTRPIAFLHLLHRLL